MRRLPIVPTIVVAIAVAAMVALGVWQLHRLAEKEALIALYARNQALPAIALPRFPDDGVLFRRASAFCLQPVGWSKQAGRAADGSMGWRQIAACRTGAEGPGFSVQLGVGSDPNARPHWAGGRVSGYITHVPDHRPLVLSGLDRTAQPLMIVADTPPLGLKPNPPADLSAVPNNHLAYAVQWFLFAAIAAIIYAIAVRRRMRAVVPPPPER